MCAKPVLPKALPKPSGEAAESKHSSLGRAFRILSLFTLATPVLKMEDIASSSGYTRSTAYRYLKELCDAGLLTRTVINGQYALGTRIIELERLLALTDPLYRAGKSVVGPMRSPDSSLLVQSLNHRNQVLCIYKEGPDFLEFQGDRVGLTRLRGVPFPLYRGAASLVILASLSPHRIKQTYLSDAKRIAKAGLGNSWPEFRERLSAVRRRGYAVSRTERKKPLVVGVAAPILLGTPFDKRVIGSIVQVFAHDLTPIQEAECAERLKEASHRIASEYVSLVTSVPSKAGRKRAPADMVEAADPVDGWQLIS